MIVFDASTIVGAALKVDGVPEQAQVAEHDRFALSLPVLQEIDRVLGRPEFSRSISRARHSTLLTLIRSNAVWFVPTMLVHDCRDAKDNKYLELALISAAHIVVSSDADLPVLDPWRSIRTVNAMEYLTTIAP